MEIKVLTMHSVSGIFTITVVVVKPRNNSWNKGIQ